MSSFRVGGKVVEKADLCRKKHWVWRLDVWPFAILYAVWLTTIVPSIDFADAAIVFGALLSSQILVLLFTAWSVDFKCFVQFSKVNNINQANACKVTPAKFSGSKEVVPLHFRSQMTGSASSGEVEEIFFDFRKQRFIYSEELRAFSKLPYPTKEIAFVREMQKKSIDRELQDKVVRFVTSQKEWKNSGGKDHVIMAHHPNSMSTARHKLYPAMFVIADFGRYSPNVANVDKDIVAPYKHLVPSYVKC